MSRVIGNIGVVRWGGVHCDLDQRAGTISERAPSDSTIGSGEATTCIPRPGVRWVVSDNGTVLPQR